MLPKLDFQTPISYDSYKYDERIRFKTLGRLAEGYFCFKTENIAYVSPFRKEANTNRILVVTQNHFSYNSLFKKMIKVLGVATGIIPLIMFVALKIFRKCNQFEAYTPSSKDDVQFALEVYLNKMSREDLVQQQIQMEKSEDPIVKKQGVMIFEGPNIMGKWILVCLVGRTKGATFAIFPFNLETQRCYYMIHPMDSSTLSSNSKYKADTGFLIDDSEHHPNRIYQLVPQKLAMLLEKDIKDIRIELTKKAGVGFSHHLGICKKDLVSTGALFVQFTTEPVRSLRRCEIGRVYIKD